MEACGAYAGCATSMTSMTSEIIDTTTYLDIISKFKDLQKNYYVDRGCMILTMNDKFAKRFLEKHANITWTATYNQYAESNVLTAKISVIIFEQPFTVHLHRPLKQVHRWEYENFFGFGGHNAGFSRDRIIITFPVSFDKNIDYEYMLMMGTLIGRVDEDSSRECCTINEKYIKNALKLLVIGGYVKGWNAFNRFKEWFKERGFNIEVDLNDGEMITSFLLEDYIVGE